MNKDDNIFLLTSIIAIILLLFAVVSLYVSKEREKDARISLQKQVDTLVVEKGGLGSLPASSFPSCPRFSWDR